MEWRLYIALALQKNMELKEQEYNFLHNNQEAFGNYFPPFLTNQQANSTLLYTAATGRSPNKCIPMNHGVITAIPLMNKFRVQEYQIQWEVFLSYQVSSKWQCFLYIFGSPEKGSLGLGWTY